MMLLLVAACLLIAGCAGEQHGLYVVGSHQTAALEPAHAEIMVVRGSRNVPRAIDKAELLLAVVSYSPGFASHSSIREFLNGAHVTEVRNEHAGPTGKFSYSVRWDRTDETVVIGNRKFRRTQGNVFLIVNTDASELDCHQIPAMIDAASIADILDRARGSVRNGSAAAAVLDRVQPRRSTGAPRDESMSR